jgi:5-methylcytosine-specific restriction endonuclease McrA
MKPYAANFYRSKAWQHCRDSYLKKVGGLCEKCLARGIYTPAVIVHHKIHLDENNIKDPAVTMNFDNLEALCRFCHAEEHSSRAPRRYRVDAEGRIQGFDFDV